MINWTEKYRPKKYSEILGQSIAIQQIKEFISNFPNGKKALVFHGPPGIGKTAIAHVAALENTMEIFELNASDLRNREKMKTVLRPAIEQKSLKKKGKKLSCKNITLQPLLHTTKHKFKKGLKNGLNRARHDACSSSYNKGNYNKKPYNEPAGNEGVRNGNAPQASYLFST